MNTELAVLLAALSLPVLVLLRRPLKRLFRLTVRSAVGLGALGALSAVSGTLGVHLGVNLVNALVLGLLGVPGLALLLMLQWVLN